MGRVGKPPYEPKAADRHNVELMKADGWSDDRIAHRLGISRPTLLKYFDDELQYGLDSQRLRVLGYLDVAASKGNASAAKMLMGIMDAAQGIGVVEGDQPRPARVRPAGKKEVEHEAAMTAGKDSEWGDDLAPLPGALN